MKWKWKANTPLKDGLDERLNDVDFGRSLEIDTEIEFLGDQFWMSHGRALKEVVVVVVGEGVELEEDLEALLHWVERVLEHGFDVLEN